MPLIKAREAESKIAKAEVLRFQDVEVEARRVLAEARLQAEAILAEAKVRAERLRADSQKTGGEVGRAEGLKTGAELGRRQAMEQAKVAFAAQHAAVAKALAAALEQFESRRRSLLSEMERGRRRPGRRDRQSRDQAGRRDRPGLCGGATSARRCNWLRARTGWRSTCTRMISSRRAGSPTTCCPPRNSSRSVSCRMRRSTAAGVLLRTAGGQVDATVETQWARILDEILAGWQEHWLLSPAMLTPDEPVDAPESSLIEVVQQDAAPPLAQQALIDEGDIAGDGEAGPATGQCASGGRYGTGHGPDCGGDRPSRGRRDRSE